MHLVLIRHIIQRRDQISRADYIAFLEFHLFDSPRDPEADIHLADINVSLKRQAALRGRRELPVNKPPSNGKHSNDS